MNYISRDLYIDRIRPFMSKDIIKVLVWARRVGKSILLQHIRDELIDSWEKNKNIIYINKEQLERSHITTHQELYDAVKDFSVIMIDEIQDIVDRELALRDLQSQWTYDIYITWSNAQLLSGELATYLWGRYVSFEIFPLVFSEFCTFHNLVSSKESFDIYMRYGGMPYLRHIWLEHEVVTRYLKDIRDTITLRDIIQRFDIKDIPLFQMLMQYLAYNIGTIFAAKNIADYHIHQWKKVTTSTVLKYLSHATQSMMIYPVPRINIKSKKLFEYKNKYYLLDTGLRNAVIWWLGDFLWWILEQMVYLHLRVAWWQIYVGDIWWLEVDFYCERGDQKMYIQVAYTIADPHTAEREYRSLIQIPDSFPKYVLSLDDHTISPREWIQHKNIIQRIDEIIDYPNQ